MWNRFKYSMQRFAMGRYGTDKLNIALLVCGLVLALLGAISHLGILTLLAYVPIVYALFRSFSRNLPARRREGVLFESFFTRMKDRQNRYFCCPKCRQMVRVPRGKGKISIRCPKCSERFLRKT